MTHRTMKSVCMTLLIISLFVLTACDSQKQVLPPKDMAGTWVGLGTHNLSSDFLDQRQIPVMLNISEAGIVTGYVGDAIILKTHLQRTPIWLRLIGNEEYRSVVKLDGYIISKESFKREGGTLLFNKVNNNELICGFNSSGSQIDSNNMTLNVKEIKLRRS